MKRKHNTSFNSKNLNIVGDNLGKTQEEMISIRDNLLSKIGNRSRVSILGRSFYFIIEPIVFHFARNLYLYF